jgi:hypothetical protein
MKRIDEVIQGEENRLFNRVAENLKDDPYLLKQWERVFNKTADIETQIEITIKVLKQSPLFF